MCYTNLSKCALKDKLNASNIRVLPDSTILDTFTPDINLDIRLNRAIHRDPTYQVSSISPDTNVFQQIIYEPNLSPITTLKPTSIINICAYSINRGFLEYLFTLNKRQLQFPKIRSSSIDTFIKKELKENAHAKIKGVKQFNHQLFVFIQFSYSHSFILNKHMHSAILDEILNIQACNSFTFDNTIRSLFYNNKDLIYTFDSDDNILDHPILNHDSAIRLIIHNAVQFYL